MIANCRVLLACLATIVALGVVHGVYTDRWGPSTELESAVDAMARVPMNIGDWRGEDVSYQAEDMVRAGIKGTLSRSFKNVKTGEEVTLLIVCGRGGPISVHTPDLCYTGAGYRMIGSERREVIQVDDGASYAFKMARFEKPGGIMSGKLEIFWAWSRDGSTWDAPENPRMALARSPALYKLYVVSNVSPKSVADSGACSNFIRRVLPEFPRYYSKPPVS